MALRGHHPGDGAGHRPCAALRSAADERHAERLLRICLAMHGEPHMGFWTPSLVPIIEDLVMAGAKVCFFVNVRKDARLNISKTHIQGLNVFWKSNHFTSNQSYSKTEAFAVGLFLNMPVAKSLGIQKR